MSLSLLKKMPLGPYLAAVTLGSTLFAGLPSMGSAAELSQFVAEKSQIVFVSKQMGVPVDGRFKKFDAHINVDPAKPEAGKASLEVDLNSIDTGSSDADSEVKGKSWFNIALFPKANFTSNQVKSLGNGRYEAVGKLTIKGISKDIVAPFTIKQDAGGALFEGSFAMQRLNFKIGEGPWADTSTVADDIQVKFKVYLAAKK